MQKAYKAVAASQYFRPIERSIVPSMEIRVHSRVKSKLGTKVALMQGAYYQEGMDMKSLKISKVFLGAKGAQSCTAGQYHRPLQRRVGPSMAIRVHSRLFLARYKGCTNARCISSRSYGHEEFKNVNPFSVQKAHKAVRAGHYLRPMQRRVEPSMEIHVHSRLIQAQYKGCTNAMCKLSRSYGHEEFKNVNPFSVQRAHKAVRASQVPCSAVWCIKWKFAYIRD